jgi:DNA polymerase III epsilon subunit-like protein
MKKLLLILPLFLFAFVKVHVNKTTVYPGEEVVFTIEATGGNIQFPKIQSIGGFPVQGSAVTTNITVLNGNMQQSISKSYIFFPTKNVTIPSYSIKTGSQTYTTKQIQITVKKPSQTQNSDFKIDLNVNKKNIYIGEPVVFKIKFYQKENTNPQSVEIQKPNFNDFFTKQLSKKNYKEKNFNVTEYTFLLIPQKAGNYKIGPILGKIGYLTRSPVNDPFFNMITSSLKYINIFSNEIDLNVSAIPKNAVFGDFTAKFTASKTEADANTPVKVSLNIKGCGDFYDLSDFKLNLPNATVYENTPVIKTYLKNGKLCGTYSKEFTIISDKDITISPVEFKSFDKTLKTVKTNSLYIVIHNNGKTAKKPQTYQTEIKPKIVYKSKTNYVLLALIFTAGVILGVLITYLMKIKFPNQDIVKKIKKADEKELFNLLLEFSYNSDIETILKKLEENIYNGKKNKINKKEIIKIIKTLIKK